MRRLKDEMATNILSMSNEEIMEVHLLGKKIVAHIDGQSYEDEKLTEREHSLILMAVSATYYDLKVLPKGTH